MTEARRQRLRAVEHVPGSVTDHGSHLTEVNGQVSTEESEILAKLDLIFSWPEASNATATLTANPPITVQCKISSDPDEAVPSELYITFLDGALRNRLSMLKKLKVNVELFRICYQFDVEVTSSGNLDDAESPIIVALPDSITTVRTRNLPRVNVSESYFQWLPRASWTPEGGRPVEFVSVNEFGLNSIAGRLAVPEASGRGTISLGELSVKGTFVRKKGDLQVFQVQVETEEQFGKLFDIYRRVAFPDLRRRTEVTSEQLFALYKKTKYLSQFVGQSDETALFEELRVVWDNIAKSQHENSADYVTVDGEGQACGASSLTHAFAGRDFSIWAFHQLCSVASPDLLDRSGQLYLWRAEYLYGRPGRLKVVAWFRSESRWLERIYVKFEKLTHGKSKLRPVAWVRGLYRSSGDAKINAEVSTIRYGDLSRSASCGGTNGQSCAGAGPEYLNACASLNGAFDLVQDPKDFETLKETTDAVLAHMGKSEHPMHFTLQHGSPVPQGFKLHPSDRFLVIEKEDLGDFLSCIEHSVSLTRKKYRT